MIGQNLYYLNNKTYITNVMNLQTLIFETNSFYHTKNPRKILIVHPSQKDMQLIESQYTTLAEFQRAGATSLITFKQWEEVANIEFIENSDKYSIAFATEDDMIQIFARYIAGLLQASGFYANADTTVEAITSHFIEKVTEADTMFTYMSSSPAMDNIRAYANGVLSNPETPKFNVTFQNGKNFSYDLLFFLNDYYPCDEVRSLLIEKFTIHSADMAQDVMEHFTARRHYMAYILSVIDWMNANGLPVDKQDFVNKTYLLAANRGNYQVAFYQLEELWNRVKDNPDFIAAHQAKKDNSSDGWEYIDIYTEINNVFPIVKKVLERTFDMNNLTADLRLINTDVQFFSKRQNRIPYLIHKYPLI
jgi:hypothetical protein